RQRQPSRRPRRRTRADGHGADGLADVPGAVGGLDALLGRARARSQLSRHPMVELETLRKEYVARSSSAPPTLAVDDLTLTVERGELLTLLGPSGCGKTTTLRMIAGFEQPTAGTIRVDG